MSKRPDRHTSTPNRIRLAWGCWYRGCEEGRYGGRRCTQNAGCSSDQEDEELEAMAVEREGLMELGMAAKAAGWTP